VRLGLVTPIVNLNPRFETPAWELEGDLDDVVAVAKAAEAVGYHWMGCPEHVAIPAKRVGERGGRYWDPVATLAYLAAHTSRLRLVSHVVVLGYHHPLAIVKRYGSLDALSHGRVVLGVGVGSLRSEFGLLGAPWDDRGARADDALAAIRASWAQPVAEYHGVHYDFADWVVEPNGVQPHLPIWVGGMSRRSLRRALEHSDGWIPFGLTLDALTPILTGERGAEARQRDGFEVVLVPEPPLDPLDEPDRAAEAVAAYAAIGATSLALRFLTRSRAHYLEQLAAMVDVLPAAGQVLDRPT
jgi:probable F420-dependent oxidoreductase